MPTPIRTRAVLFDLGGTLFDYASLAPARLQALIALGERLGMGQSPAELARAMQAATAVVFRRYLPLRYYLHADLFRDALDQLAQTLGVSLGEGDREFFFSTQARLRAQAFALRPGVVETLNELRARGLHLGVVSNIDEAELHHLIELGGLRSHFDSLLSSELAQSCKPDARIFQLALARAGCGAEEALFVGDTLAQDIAGANRAGLRSVLLWHRDDRPAPTGGALPAHIIRQIPDLTQLV